MMLISLAAVALCAGNVAAHPAFSKHPEGDLIGMHADARLESDESGAVVFTIPVENKVFSSGAQYRLTLQAVARTAGKEGGVQFVAHWSFTKDTIVEDCLKVWLGDQLVIAEMYDITFQIEDAFPHLSEDDALLAKRTTLGIPFPKSLPDSEHPQHQSTPDEAPDSIRVGDGAGQVSAEVLPSTVEELQLRVAALSRQLADCKARLADAELWRRAHSKGGEAHDGVAGQASPHSCSSEPNQDGAAGAAVRRQAKDQAVRILHELDVKIMASDHERKHGALQEPGTGTREGNGEGSSLEGGGEQELAALAARVGADSDLYHRLLDGKRVMEDCVERLELPLLHEVGEAVEMFGQLRMGESLGTFHDRFRQGYDSCDDDYLWWRDISPSLRAVCLSGLLAIPEPWSCPQGARKPTTTTSTACSRQPGRANATSTGTTQGASALDGPDAWPKKNTLAQLLRDVAEPEATNRSHDSIPLDDEFLVAVATARGAMFEQRRVQMEALLSALELTAVYVQAVSRDMVAQGGVLESCRPIRPGEAGLPDSYAANGLNQLQLFLHAWRRGYDHVLVLEDDVTLAPAFPDARTARTALREAMAEAPRGYDLIFLGDCCEISNQDERPESSRVRKWLFETPRASRCANAYIVSRSGMQKMLLQLPVWCSIDWMMNSAKFATADTRLQTKVYTMDPPLFVEGSKVGALETTLEASSRALRGEVF